MHLSEGYELVPYEVPSPVGAGGMGEAYKARDTRLVRTVVMRVLLFALAGASICLAQSQYASLSGTVIDPGGASVPNVSIQLINVSNGERQSTLSNAAGTYAVPLLRPGMYRMEAEGEGFKRYVRTGIQLETGTQAGIDIELELGVRTESITVDAATPQLQSETSAVGAVIDNRNIANMPLLDRRAAQLTALAGFVVSDGSGTLLMIAGGRGGQANWILDGGNAQGPSLGAPLLTFNPPVESLQEFHVSISNYAAELGRTGGGVMQMTTKSGSNQFHGSAYDYLRNDALDARGFFSADKPALRYNLFGASLGGPVRKDRTFFFYNYEARRRTLANTVIRNVPATAELTGDFSANRTVIRDPSTAARNPFPGNTIPRSRFDPIGAQLAALYPLPNVPGRASGNSNFNANVPTSTPYDVHVARVDQNFSERDRMFVRFAASNSASDVEPTYPAPAADDQAASTKATYYNVSGTWFHQLSRVWLNEIRITFTRTTSSTIPSGGGSGLNGKLGIGEVDATGFARISATGYAGMSSALYRLQGPNADHQFTERLTMIRGSHSWKVGVEYRTTTNDELGKGNAGGVFAFNNLATGNAIAAMLLGWVQQGQFNQTPRLLTRSFVLGAFVQDDWKITPKLTLNFGLRYDLDQPRWEQDNQQNSFDRYAINPVSGTPGVVTFSGRNGLSKYLNRWDPNNLGPRLGFAWRAAEGWVVRGGGALLFLPQFDSPVGQQNPLGYDRSATLVSPDGGLTPAFLMKNGLPRTPAPTEADRTPGFGAVPLGVTPTTTVGFAEPDRRLGYLETFNFNIQRQITGTALMEVGYLATLGHKLAPSIGGITINQVPRALLGPGNAQNRRPFPQFTQVTVIFPMVGNSNYHAMNVKLDKRASHGVHFQANYTWSRLIDDVETRVEPGGSNGTGRADSYSRKDDRGLSGWNVNHRLVASSVWQMPVLGNYSMGWAGSWLGPIVNGWSVGYVAELRTGFPYGVTELTNTTNSFSESQRPNIVGNPALPSNRPKADQLAAWFNVNAFAAPAPFTFGNGGRTNGYGPGLLAMDISALKDFRIHDRHSIQFRAEIFNFLNHPSFGLPNLSRGSAAFGQISSTSGSSPSRMIQLGLHYRF